MTDGSHQLRPDSFFPLNSEVLVPLLPEKIEVVLGREDDPRLSAALSISWSQLASIVSMTKATVKFCFCLA